MADLAADNQMPHMGTPTKLRMPCAAATTFYKGALVWAAAASGKAVTDAFSAGDLFLGICAKKVVTTAADQMVEVFVDGIWGFKISGTTSADMGHKAIIDASADSNNPDDVISTIDATEAAGDILLGGILTVYDSRAWVKLTGLYPIYTAAATDGHTSFRFAAES
jgi:hypothetical protein